MNKNAKILWVLEPLKSGYTAYNPTIEGLEDIGFINLDGKDNFFWVQEEDTRLYPQHLQDILDKIQELNSEAGR